MSYRRLQELCMAQKERHSVRCNSPKNVLKDLSRRLVEYYARTDGEKTIKILSWNMWYKSSIADCHIIIDALKRSDADIIAIQEGVHAPLFNMFASQNGYLMSHLSNLGKEQQFTLWRSSVGKAVQVSKGLFEAGRPYTVIRFSNPSFTFVNLHAGHGYDTASYFRRIPLSSQDERIVMAGDFNKDLKRLRIGRSTLLCGATKSLNTCCAVGPHKSGRATHSADHIMSTMKFSENTHVYPHGHAASDHLPITASVTVIIRGNATRLSG